MSQNSNGHISVVCEATVRWLGTLVVLHVLHADMTLTDMTLTRYAVKVKVTGLLNFQKLAKLCMLAAHTAQKPESPLVGGSLVFVTQNFAHFPRPNHTADFYIVWFIRCQSQVISLLEG